VTSRRQPGAQPRAEGVLVADRGDGEQNRSGSNSLELVVKRPLGRPYSQPRNQFPGAKKPELLFQVAGGEVLGSSGPSSRSRAAGRVEHPPLRSLFVEERRRRRPSIDEANLDMPRRARLSAAAEVIDGSRWFLIDEQNSFLVASSGRLRCCRRARRRRRFDRRWPTTWAPDDTSGHPAAEGRSPGRGVGGVLPADGG